MDEENIIETFTTRLDRNLIKMVRMYCLDQEPRIKIKDFVTDALKEALRKKAWKTLKDNKK